MRLCDVDFSNDEHCRGAKRTVGKCKRGKCGKYNVMRTTQLAGASRGVTRMRCVDSRRVVCVRVWDYTRFLGLYAQICDCDEYGVHGSSALR